MLVPEIPAFYYWVLDMESGHRDADQWRTLFRQISTLRGPKQFSDRIAHLDLECYVSPEAFNPDLVDEIVQLQTANTSISSWFGHVLSIVQRPLYVGITSDISVRLSDHLDEDGGLADDLRGQIDIADCALVYYELPSELLDEMFVELAGSASDTSRLGNSPTGVDGDPLETPDPPQLPRALRLLEYSAIRTSMPVFNSVKRNLEQ